MMVLGSCLLPGCLAQEGAGAEGGVGCVGVTRGALKALQDGLVAMPPGVSSKLSQP